MRTGITVHLSPTDRKRLRAIVDDRNSAQKHVWRAKIVLATADGLGTLEIMRTAGVSKTAVWRWQARFMEAGVEGLLRDKTRPPRIPKLADEVADRIIALTLGEPPGETTHWTGRVMARAAGVRADEDDAAFFENLLNPIQGPRLHSADLRLEALDC